MKQVSRLYDTPRWRALRKMHLASHPLCALCMDLDRSTPATVVDHIQPHNGNPELFWSMDNFQSLCAPCHSAAKRMQETHGYSQAANKNGLPLDPGHPWYQKESQR